MYIIVLDSKVLHMHCIMYSVQEDHVQSKPIPKILHIIAHTCSPFSRRASASSRNTVTCSLREIKFSCPLMILLTPGMLITRWRHWMASDSCPVLFRALALIKLYCGFCLNWKYTLQAYSKVIHYSILRKTHWNGNNALTKNSAKSGPSDSLQNYSWLQTPNC